MSELLPLNERLTAPSELPEISHPDIALVRPAELSDLDALVTLVHAAEAVDHPTWASPRDEVEDLIDNPRMDRATDSLIAFDADGRAIAHVVVHPASGADTRVQMYVFGTVHPDVRNRGIATQLIRWGRDRAQQRLAERTETLPAWIAMYAHERTADAISAAQDAGFGIERYFLTMERDLAEEIPDVALPSDIELVSFSPEVSEGTRLGRNDAFRDHWGSQPTPQDKWERFVSGDIFRNDLSVVAVERDTRRVVAFALSSVNEDDTELQGYRASYIDLIGVVRDRRGQKLAPAVIAENLRRARADGLAAVTLDVDSASPTGANSLYEGIGFRATDVEVALIINF